MIIKNITIAVAFCLCALAFAADESEATLDKLTYPRFSYPTWSPDGSRVLYESSVSGNWEIYTVDLEGISDNGGNVTKLTNNTDLDRMPSWSPDGQFIAFISDRDGDFEVFRMRPDGTEQSQLTYNDLPEIHPYWTPDSQRIVFNSRLGEQRIYDIWIMNRDGSEQTILLQDGELNSYAQMSPDGTQIVFDKWQDNNENNGEIYVLDVKSRELRRLTNNEDIYDGYPTWTPDGERIIFASEVGDDFKLFSIRPDGSGRNQLTFGPGSDARASVSPDGTKMLFNRGTDGNINIMLAPLPEEPDALGHVPSTALDLHPAIKPVITGIDAYPRPSPDGKSVTFVSDRSGGLEIYRVNLDTGDISRLTNNDASDNMPVFSPDGEKILFMSDRSGDYEIWEMNTDGSDPVKITNNPANDFRPRYSSDGKFVIFDSDRDAPAHGQEGDDNLELYVMRMETKEVNRLTNSPHWDIYGSFSPNGDQVAFSRSWLTADPNRPHSDVFVKDIASGRERQLTFDFSYVGYTQWSPSGEWIVFASDRYGTVDRSGTDLYDFDIFIIRPDGTDLTRLTHGGGAPESFWRPSFSMDGRLIYANRVLGEREDLVVIELPGGS